MTETAIGSIVELLRKIIGVAPAGFGLFEYLFSFVLLLVVLFLIWEIVETLFHSFF